jgi:hypothetical protein
LKHKPVIIIAIVLFTFIILLGYLAFNWNNRHITQYIQVTECQIAMTSCTVELDKKTSIQVNILPRGIPESSTLSISVNTEGLPIDEASVIFEGVEIDTLTPEYPLYQSDSTNFSGKGFLVICSLSKMHWIAHIIIVKGGEVWRVSFPFEKTLNEAILQ